MAKDKGFKFYPFNGGVNIDETKEWLEIPVSDETMTVYIKTPDGWKCPRKGCTTEIYHKHTTYANIK